MSNDPNTFLKLTIFEPTSGRELHVNVASEKTPRDLIDGLVKQGKITSVAGGYRLQLKNADLLDEATPLGDAKIPSGSTLNVVRDIDGGS